MIREDYGLGFLIQYENVAWYENGMVKILDRRLYPMETKYVVCKTHTEVAHAIRDMVTQSGGPFSACAMGMVLACENCKTKTYDEQLKFMQEASYTLSNARPTTSTEMKRIADACFNKFKTLLENGSDNITDEMFLFAIEQNNKRYSFNCSAGKHLAKIIPDGATILTQCFGEVAFGGLFRALKEMNKTVKIVSAETRPYLQGARLTASLAYSMGFETTVITDNMPASEMQSGHIDFFVSASDLITMDGHIINKVGTLQIALSAKYFGIPYYAFGLPDPAHPTVDNVVIEYRNPDEAIHFFETQTVVDGVKGSYPAFDITPPELCAGIVTNEGIINSSNG